MEGMTRGGEASTWHPPCLGVWLGLHSCAQLSHAEGEHEARKHTPTYRCTHTRVRGGAEYNIFSDPENAQL